MRKTSPELSGTFADLQLRILNRALRLWDDDDLHLFMRYLELRSLFVGGRQDERPRFCRLFAKHFGLNAARLTPVFRKQYFEYLFNLKIRASSDPYAPALRFLYKVSHKLNYSFVSKLVAIHDETSPIYDRHVRSFFAIPRPAGSRIGDRIASFVETMDWLQRTYRVWLQDERFQSVLRRLKSKHPETRDCDDARLADFLIWTAGRKGLLRQKR